MGKTTHITAPFLGKFIRVQGLDLVAVQKLLFRLGFKWNSCGRKPAKYVGNPTKYIRVEEYGALAYDTSYDTPHDYPHVDVKGEFTLAELEAAVKAFNVAKKAAKKDSRLRRQGWIKNTGTSPNYIVPFDIILKDGKRVYSHTAGSGLDFNTSYYSDYCTVDYHRPSRGQVVVGRTAAEKQTSHDYRYARWSTNKSIFKEGVAKTVTLMEMVDKIVSDAGGTEVVAPDTNPKKQFGDKSIPLNLWPALASAYGALGLYNGKLKYGLSNFNATPVEASIYIAGAKRHLEAWAEGEEFDPADGVPNLGGVLANIAILLEARAAGTLIDDRKLGTGYLKERESLKAIVASLQVLHADKNPRHYTIADTK